MEDIRINNRSKKRGIIQADLSKFFKTNDKRRVQAYGKFNKEDNSELGNLDKENASKNTVSDEIKTNMSKLQINIGNEWYKALENEFKKPYFIKCQESVNQDRIKKPVYPIEELVFNAFKLTPLSKIKVVIVGQDPYHQPNQAMGLCFSVQKGIKLPPSLKNIFKEIGIISEHGDLTSWAEQGVFLLNALLTVIDSEPMAHRNTGWEQFTDHVIDVINKECKGIVFLLWGKSAQKKASKVDIHKHHILTAGHPSPLSVRLFQGCKHFEICNEILKSQGKDAINWTKL